MAFKLNPLTGEFDMVVDNHTKLTNIGTNTHAQIDTHLAGHSATVLWSEVNKTISDIADIATKSHTSLSDIGTNTHTQIDSHIASTANPHSVTASQVSAIPDAIDTVKDTHIDWGTGASQVSADDIPDGATNIIPTATQESNWDSHLTDTNDPHNITWAQVDKTTSDIADITTKSHTSLTDIGTNTHTTIDSHIADTTIHYTKASINLDDLGDVNAPTPADNDSLTWDAATSKWVPEAVSGGGGGATTALDNLASVAVNTSIISDTDSTDDLGSSAIRWANIYGDTGHFANIADTGGTNRITLATSSPQVTLGNAVTSNTKVTGTMGIMSNPKTDYSNILNISPTLATAQTPAFPSILKLNPTIQSNQAFTLIYALEGIASVQYSGGGTVYAYGLSYVVNAVNTGATNTWGEVFCVNAGYYTNRFAGTENITAAGGLVIPTPVNQGGTTNLNITSSYGIWIKAQTQAAATTVYGLAVENITGGTNKYVIEAGGTLGSAPYFRIVGNFTAAANQTPIYISEGATPTLRQVQWKDGASIGAGDKVMVLV